MLEKQKSKNSIGIIGGGSWATAIAKILTSNSQDVHWWLRQQETVDHIRKFGHNPKYLSSVQFDLAPNLVSTDLKEIVSQSYWLIFAVPSFFFTEIIGQLSAEDLKGKKIASAIKGITQHEHCTISQYLNMQFGVPTNLLANISGPCHAEEVAAEKLSYLTFSSPDLDLANELADMFANRFMRTSVTKDLVGTEYASVIKNIFAIAAGISVGLGYGDNFRAVLVSEAMEEMNYFLKNVNPAARDILSPPYLGDTLVTSYSQYSRNRTFGLMIGSGYTINSAILELNMVAEGYYASNAIKALCLQYNLKMPVADTVYRILYEKMPPADEFVSLSKQLC